MDYKYIVFNVHLKTYTRMYVHKQGRRQMSVHLLTVDFLSAYIIFKKLTKIFGNIK